MASLGEELALRIGAVQRSLEAESAAPLDGTASVIRRKRAVRQGTTAGIAAVAAVAVAGIGTTAVRRALDAQPAAYWLPPGGGIVEIPVDEPNPTYYDTGIECGDPAPEPLTEDDGFVLETKLRDPDPEYMNARQGIATVRNRNEKHFPAFVLQPEIVMVKDGVVVGVQKSAGLVSSLFFTPGRDFLVSDFYAGDWGECGGELVTLEPGDYEIYVVTTTTNSPEVAALSRVSPAYGFQPFFTEDPWLEPNDWECDNDVAWGIGSIEEAGLTGSYAVACLPSQDPRVAWNSETRSLVLPYSDSVVSRVFTTVLVSEPIPLTLYDHDLFYRGDSPWDHVPTDADAVCGADLGYGDVGMVSRVELYSQQLTYPRLTSDPSIEGFAWTEWGPGLLEGRIATVSTPERARVYLTAQGSEYMEEYGAWKATAQVVGSGWVTVNHGNDINLSRALGPTTTAIEFEDIEWCPGLPELGELTATVVGGMQVRTDTADEDFPVFFIRAGHVV